MGRPPPFRRLFNHPATMKLATALLALVGVAVAHDYNSDVVELTSDNFDEKVESGAWLVKLYAPWCGHCKRLKPTWDELATATKGDYNIGAVDCTTEKELCGKHGVRGYPTILYFPDGEITDGEKYQGQRDLGALKSFLESA